MDNFDIPLNQYQVAEFWVMSHRNYAFWEVFNPDPEKTSRLQWGTELRFIYQNKTIATALMVNVLRKDKNLTLFWNSSSFLDMRECSRCHTSKGDLAGYLAIGTRRKIMLCNRCRASVDNAGKADPKK